jgi:uncharacterized protein (TIGR00255 family)
VLLSMTGFGQSVVHADALTCSVELRAVNNRFLKINVRIPDCYSAFEPRLEKLIRDAVKRGTVTIAVKLEGERASAGYKINTEVLRQLLRDLREATGCNPEQVVAGLLALPEVVERSGPAADLELLWPTVEKAVREALAKFQDMRKVEGAAMGAEIDQLRGVMATLVAAVEGRAHASVRQYHDRFHERVSSLLGDYGVAIEKNDLIREIAILAERFDVAEELARLRSHLDQFRVAPSGNESVGRKWEFLTQELHREANTIGSKANDLEIAHWIVDLKTQIERVREIVQNVE